MMTARDKRSYGFKVVFYLMTCRQVAIDRLDAIGEYS